MGPARARSRRWHRLFVAKIDHASIRSANIAENGFRRFFSPLCYSLTAIHRSGGNYNTYDQPAFLDDFVKALRRHSG
jgi:hypothetical protein